MVKLKHEKVIFLSFFFLFLIFSGFETEPKRFVEFDVKGSVLKRS